MSEGNIKKISRFIGKSPNIIVEELRIAKFEDGSYSISGEVFLPKCGTYDLRKTVYADENNLIDKQTMRLIKSTFRELKSEWKKIIPEALLDTGKISLEEVVANIQDVFYIKINVKTEKVTGVRFGGVEFSRIGIPDIYNLLECFDLR